MTNLTTKSGQAVIHPISFFPGCFLLVLLTLIMPRSGLAKNADAQFPHLRIAYGEEQALQDGTVSFPLEIRLENIQGDNSLKNLSEVTAEAASLPAFEPSIKQTEKQTEPLVYRPIPVIKKGDKWMILLMSGAPRNFAVRVQAHGIVNGKKTYLAAETNCLVFGRKLKTKSVSKAEVCPPAWFSGLGMGIDPPFYYWPQTEVPLRVTLNFGNRVLPKTMLTVFDESFPPARFLTDQAGQAVYVPPNDPALNRKSEKASKQVFLFSFHSEGDNLFVVARTLRLHRNRQSHFQPHMGLALFGITVLVASGTVILIRHRRRQGEYS